MSRKNWSMSFSASDNDARSSWTTLPMVCRSETRRYSSSIQLRADRVPCPDAPRPGVRQALNALGLLGVIEIGVFEHGFDIEQAGRHFHRQRRRRRGAASCVMATVSCNSVASLAEWKQALKRITNKRELLGQAGKAVHFAAGHGRPGSFAAATRLRAWSTQAGS